MSAEPVAIPKEAFDEATVAVSAVVGEVSSSAGYARAAVEAAAPLIRAAAAQAMLDDAFPDGEDSDYHYGCERLFELVTQAASALGVCEDQED